MEITSNKKLLVSGFFFTLVVISTGIILSYFPNNTTPSSTEILNSKSTIVISGEPIKLTSGETFDKQPGANYDGRQLYVLGSISSLQGEKLNHQFNYNEIINVWVVLNSVIYQAYIIEPGPERSNSLFQAFFKGENLSKDINNITLDNRNETEIIEVVIELDHLGKIHLLKSFITIDIVY